MDRRSFERAFARFHLTVYTRVSGRLGRRLAGNTTLVLATTGRRTGERRQTVLAYARRGRELVVVGSNYGGDRDPAWLLNIRAQPRVEVLVGPQHIRATAREVTAQDSEYPDLWRLANAQNHNRYDGHQRETSRPIPLVVIAPDA